MILNEERYQAYLHERTRCNPTVEEEEIGKVGEIIVGCNRSEQLALMCASEEAVVNK